MTTSILLAHPHQIFRHGLRMLIEQSPDMKVIAEADDGDAAVELACTHRPHLALLDISLPGKDGVDTLEAIRRKVSSVKIIIMVMSGDRWRVSDALRAGAGGVLCTDCEPNELTRAIQSVQEGRIFLSPGISDVLVQQYVRPGVGGDRVPLTDRQREVLQLMAEGKSSKEIAAQLKISSKTVDTHRLDVMAKLRLFTVAELTKYALRQGLTTLDV